MTKQMSLILAIVLLVGTVTAGTVHAQQSDREIVVWGSSVLKKPPTVLQLDITVMSIAPTAKEGAETADMRAEEMIAEFRQFGLKPNDWKLERAMIRKPLPDEPKRLAFWATVTLSVRIDDFTAVTDMLDQANVLKAAHIKMEFQLDDPDLAYETALEHAIDDARRRAEIVARELNVTLGPPLGCEEMSGGPTPMRRYTRKDSDDLFAPDHTDDIIPDPKDLTTIDPKPIEVNARVRARFAIVR